MVGRFAREPTVVDYARVRVCGIETHLFSSINTMTCFIRPSNDLRKLLSTAAKPPGTRHRHRKSVKLLISRVIRQGYGFAENRAVHAWRCVGFPNYPKKHRAIPEKINRHRVKLRNITDSSAAMVVFLFQALALAASSAPELQELFISGDASAASTPWVLPGTPLVYRIPALLRSKVRPPCMLPYTYPSVCVLLVSPRRSSTMSRAQQSLVPE